MKPVLRILGILALIAAAVAVAVPLLFDADSFRPLLESRMTSPLGRDVKVARLKLSIFSARVVADDLSVSEDPAFGANPFLKAKALRLRVVEGRSYAEVAEELGISEENARARTSRALRILRESPGLRELKEATEGV